MIDAFKFSSWDDVTSGPFWQYGFGGSPELWIMTVIGMVVTVLAIVGWFWVEHQKLMEQRSRLRAAGFGRQGPGSSPS